MRDKQDFHHLIPSASQGSRIRRPHKFCSSVGYFWFQNADVEKAEAEFLMSLVENPNIPAEFKKEIQAALAAWTKANDAPAEMMEKYFMKMAKTEKEKDFVRKMMEEAKKE